jgi:predicted O-methyltransferase YrrM
VNNSDHIDPEPVSLQQDFLRIIADDTLLPVAITRVPLARLHEEFGFDAQIDWTPPDSNSTFENWDIKTHDAALIRYIFRNFKPKRHLEFGTGSGASALYCLEESTATVYTINTPFGVRDDLTGGPVYTFSEQESRDASAWSEKTGCNSSVGARSDILPFIGREYLEKGHGKRVCQIYCDSREWDTSTYPGDFFDSAFIDCGANTLSFVNESKKAFSLVRPGGIIMWYGFFIPSGGSIITPDNAVSCRIVTKQDWLKPHTKKLFWACPSKLFIAVRF